MEETPEGLATAAATREAAKKQRTHLEAHGVIDDQPAVKKATVVTQAISHEVALPAECICDPVPQPELHGVYTCASCVCLISLAFITWDFTSV